MEVCLLAVGAAAPSLRVSAQSVAGAWGGRGSAAVSSPDEDVLTLSWSAGVDALEATDLAPGAIDALWWGTPRPPFADGPSHLTTALRLRDDVGGAVVGGSAHAGIDALFAAWGALVAGFAQTALVHRSERCASGDRDRLGAARRCGCRRIHRRGPGRPGANRHPIYNRGKTAPVIFAPFASRHMHEFGTTREMLAAVAVKNHYNGARDPYAHFRNEITIEQALAAPPICSPPQLLHCCPQTDGAAAVLPVREDLAQEFKDKPAYIAGFGVATNHPVLHEKSTFVSLPATTAAAKRAYAVAGVEPRQIDMAEVHDCFTITDILDIEDLDFCENGKGGVLSIEGGTPIAGRIPINTSGGLPEKGHPIGATGIAQLTECWWQLRGEAEERHVQIRNRYVLQHNVGGRGSGVSVVNILTTQRP